MDIGSGLMFVEHQPTSIAKIDWQAPPARGRLPDFETIEITVRVVVLRWVAG